MMVWLWLAICLTQVDAAFEDDLDFSFSKEIRPNHGVIFQPLSKKLLVSSSSYNLIITIDRPKLFTHYTCPTGTEDDMSKFCQTLRDEEIGQFNGMISSINEIQDGIGSILHSPLNTNNTRQSRALLGFIGKISRTLFGTATTEDLAKVAAIVENALSRLNQQNAANSDEFHLLHATTNVSAKAFADLQKGVLENFHMIANLIRSTSYSNTMLKGRGPGPKALGLYIKSVLSTTGVSLKLKKGGKN